MKFFCVNQPEILSTHSFFQVLCVWMILWSLKRDKSICTNYNHDCTLPVEGGVTCRGGRVVVPVEGGVTRGGWCDPWRVV